MNKSTEIEEEEKFFIYKFFFLKQCVKSSVDGYLLSHYSSGMQNLKPDYFFDLSKSRHASLFQGLSYVWEVIPKISDYLKTATLGIIECEIPDGVHLISPEQISIGKGTIVEPGAYIKGPCIIGQNCTVRHGAYIRGDFICGDHCVIGHDTEVKNSLFLDSAHAAHFAYLGDTILGNRVNLGAGTKCANLKLDNNQVQIQIDSGAIPTGLRKFGAIIGDDSQTGCNSVTNPGTLLGKKVFIYPCLNVGGFIPSKHTVKEANNLKIIKRA